MFGSRAARKFLVRTAADVGDVRALVGDRIFVGWVPEEVPAPWLLITKQDAKDGGAPGRPITEQEFRFEVALTAEGWDDGPLVGPATALHLALHGTQAQVDGLGVFCFREGELVFDPPPEHGVPYVRLGGTYVVQVLA